MYLEILDGNLFYIACCLKQLLHSRSTFQKKRRGTIAFKSDGNSTWDGVSRAWRKYQQQYSQHASVKSNLVLHIKTTIRRNQFKFDGGVHRVNVHVVCNSKKLPCALPPNILMSNTSSLSLSFQHKLSLWLPQI